MSYLELQGRVRALPSTLWSAFWSSETAVMLTFAVLVGLGAALSAVAFQYLIDFFHRLFFGSADRLALFGGVGVILLPALGGLLVGPLLYFLVPEAKGHGIPQVLVAIAARRGRIQPAVALVKTVASAITIGSGGSVGREGPIAQIGAALGSTVGQIFKLNERRVVGLVAAGAAAGVAAAFNTPIAGVMFALEVILGDFGMQAFSAVVVAAVTASVVSRAVFGDFPAFFVPAYRLVSPWELLLYMGLGVACGGGAVLFMKVLHWMEDLFERWKFPPYLKPAAGGLALGVLGYFVPQLFGTGAETIADVLAGDVGLGMLLVLIGGKILAASLTLGSGGSGGVFLPALFIGAMIGGAYGTVAHSALPDLTAASGAYAMVGMAAVFAGMAHAPITAILILFELTRDYHVILPLMFATVVSTALSHWLQSESIYTFRLKRRGIDVRARKDVNLMRAILVGEAMTPVERLTTVKGSLALADLARLFQESARHGFAVVDEHGQLCGVVALADLERAVATRGISGTVADVCTTRMLTAFPDETLDDALRHFGATDVGRIPVVDRHNPRRLLGMLRRSDVVHAYSHTLVDEQQRARHVERLRLESAAGTDLIEISLEGGDAAVGRQLREIALPDECVVVSIRRGRRVVVPRGNTRLLAGDRVVALAGVDAADGLYRALRE